MRKKLAVFLAVIIALDVVALSVIFFTRNSSNNLDINADPLPGPASTTTEEQILFSTVSFVAVGDNLIHKPIYNQAAARMTDGYDFSYAYNNVKEFVRRK